MDSIPGGDHHEIRFGFAFVKFDLAWLCAIELNVEIARLQIGVFPRVHWHSVGQFDGGRLSRQLEESLCVPMWTLSPRPVFD